MIISVSEEENQEKKACSKITGDTVSLKGQCHKIFCFLCFLSISFPPSPQSIPLGPFRFEFFRKYSEIFAAQG